MFSSSKRRKHIPPTPAPALLPFLAAAPASAAAWLRSPRALARPRGQRRDDKRRHPPYRRRRPATLLDDLVRLVLALVRQAHVAHVLSRARLAAAAALHVELVADEFAVLRAVVLEERLELLLRQLGAALVVAGLAASR